MRNCMSSIKNNSKIIILFLLTIISISFIALCKNSYAETVPVRSLEDLGTFGCIGQDSHNYRFQYDYGGGKKACFGVAYDNGHYVATSYQIAIVLDKLP